MNEQAILIGLSHLGIVFAGLISVFIIFAARDGEFPPPERQHVRGLILTSFPVVIGSMLPFAFFLYGASDTVVWRGSGTIAFVLGTIMSVENFLTYLKMSKSDKKENGYAHAITAFGLNFVAGVMLAMASLGIAAKANYIVALMVILLIGVSSFVTFAAHRFLGVKSKKR